MFEKIVEQGMFKSLNEKTAIEKLLARKNIEDIRTLIRKPDMSRADTLELLYLISGEEIKLWNWDAQERYVITKYFVWVQEFIKTCQIFYDFQEDLSHSERLCVRCMKHANKYVKKEVDGTLTLEEPNGKTTPIDAKSVCECGDEALLMIYDQTSEKSIRNTERYLEHESKFLLMLYLNLGRSSLSQSGVGFFELLKNKFEFVYPTTAGGAAGDGEKKSWFKWS